MTRKTDEATSRRDFLKLAGAAAPAAVAVAASGQAVEAAEPEPSSDKLPDNAHTRTYYDTARF